MFRNKSGEVTRVSRKNGNGKLSGKMLDYLERKYQLSPQDMLNLRAVYSESWLGNMPACFMRIYDRRALNDCIKTYSDLENYPDLILYNGHILGNGFVYVTKCNTRLVCQGS
jgi:hypothetical protein